MPALGISLLLIAAGAVLAFAVTTSVDGVAVATAGVVLMAVGFLGLLIALFFLFSFSPFASHQYLERTGHRRHHP